MASLFDAGMDVAAEAILASFAGEDVNFRRWINGKEDDTEDLVVVFAEQGPREDKYGAQQSERLRTRQREQEARTAVIFILNSQAKDFRDLWEDLERGEVWKVARFVALHGLTKIIVEFVDPRYTQKGGALV